MPAYLLLLAALLSRVLPHSGWYGFTAVGGSLLYFGARRRGREMLAAARPSLSAAADYYLTTHVYDYAFQWQDYLVTWPGTPPPSSSAPAAGKSTRPARCLGRLLGPTSFFLVSNFSVWVGSAHARAACMRPPLPAC